MNGFASLLLVKLLILDRSRSKHSSRDSTLSLRLPHRLCGPQVVNKGLETLYIRYVNEPEWFNHVRNNAFLLAALPAQKSSPRHDSQLNTLYLNSKGIYV